MDFAPIWRLWPRHRPKPCLAARTECRAPRFVPMTCLSWQLLARTACTVRLSRSRLLAAKRRDTGRVRHVLRRPKAHICKWLATASDCNHLLFVAIVLLVCLSGSSNHPPAGPRQHARASRVARSAGVSPALQDRGRSTSRQTTVSVTACPKREKVHAERKGTGCARLDAVERVSGPCKIRNRFSLASRSRSRDILVAGVCEMPAVPVQIANVVFGPCRRERSRSSCVDLKWAYEGSRRASSLSIRFPSMSMISNRQSS